MIRMRIGGVRTVMTLLVRFQVGAIALLGAVIKASGKITCPHIVLVLSLCEVPLGKDLKIQRLIRKGGGLKWLIGRLWWWRLDRPIKQRSIILHLDNRKYTSRLSQELSSLCPHPRLNNAKVLINLENLFEKKRVSGFPEYAGPPREILNPWLTTQAHSSHHNHYSRVCGSLQSVSRT